MQNATFGRRVLSPDYSFARLLSLVVVLAGLWQIVAPFLLSFADDRAATWNAIGAGIVLALFAGLGAWGAGRWSQTMSRGFEWLTSIAGLWLAISPFIFGYRDISPAFWSALAVGLVGFIVGGYVASQIREPETASST